MSEETTPYREIDGDNPAEHVELLPADPARDQLETTLGLVKKAAASLPATLSESMVEPAEIEVDVDQDRFTNNRPQAGFVKIPWPVATKDPDNEGQAIWWYAAALHEHQVVLEGARGPDVKAFAMATAYRPKRVNAADLVEELPENEPQAGVEKGEARSARGAGARKGASSRMPSVVVPNDCEIVFRHMVAGEKLGSWPTDQIAAFVILELWGARSHPLYVKLRGQAAGWEETKPDPLYPDAGGLYR